MLLTVLNVGRVLDLYDAESPEHGVTEVAAQLDMSKSKAHLLLSSMTEIGLLRRIPGGRYQPGWRAIELERLVSHSAPYRTAARRVAAELVRASGDTVHVAALDRGQVVCVERIAGVHELPSIEIRQGTTPPPHSSSVGKVLLASLGAAEIDAILDRHGMPAMTPHTITDRDRLYAELHRIRRDGFARDREEVALGMACVAAPITAANGEVAAAISLSTTPARMRAGEATYAATIQRAARMISERTAALPV